jgi:hypothetical protein
MHAQRMDEIQEALFDRIREIRQSKGREYATEEDTLSDFKDVAAEAGTTPLQVWLTYVKKHERAVDTYIREGSTKSESIQDRVLDIVVYHILMLGLIEDLDPLVNEPDEGTGLPVAKPPTFPGRSTVGKIPQPATLDDPFRPRLDEDDDPVGALEAPTLVHPPLRAGPAGEKEDDQIPTDPDDVEVRPETRKRR